MERILEVELVVECYHDFSTILNLNSAVVEKGESLNLLRYQAFVAEEEGFEPPWGCPQTVFKTAAL